jgi:uncharacterized repeat protein (TIGR01451 family)
MTNKLNKTLLSTAILGLVLAFVPASKPVFGQYYGGGVDTPSIVVDKKIRPIDSRTYFENIGSEQKVFTEGEQIEFKIVVENRGNTVLKDIKVKDILPDYLKTIVFPGKYISVDNSIETTIDSLEPGRSKEFIIVAKISDLPASNYAGAKLQMTNRVKATSGNVSDTDEAKYFVEMKSVPSTGAGGMVVNTLLAVTIISSAFGLRKIVRKY